MNRERIKHLSDRLILWFLNATSEFEKELTEAGRREQSMWRQQRLRDLQGLAVRWRQRHEKKEIS
jgi:hypothetical protein